MRKIQSLRSHVFECARRGLLSARPGATRRSARSGRGVASDPLGNVLLTGYFERGPIDFGDGPLVPAGGTDIFIAKIIP